jgi:hypothetical protein
METASPESEPRLTSWDGVVTTSLGPRNLFQATGSATLIEGFDSASYGRTSIGALCPITSMAPVLAITGMVARMQVLRPRWGD